MPLVDFKRFTHNTCGEKSETIRQRCQLDEGIILTKQENESSLSCCMPEYDTIVAKECGQ